MKLYCCYWLFLIACTFPMFAQEGIHQNTFDKYLEGIALYQKEKYLSALQKFNQYQSSNPEGDKRIESQYYAAACNLHLQHPSAQKQLLDFIETYPYHSITQKAHIEISYYFFLEKNYTDALYHLEKIDISDGRDEKILEVKFQKAYCYLATEQPEKAKTIFKEIKKGGKYAAISNFHTGYFAYKENNLDAALKDLEVASNDDKLISDCLPLILDIYYQKKNFDKVINLGETLKQKGIEYPKKTNILIGDAYFEKKNFQKAIIYFENSFIEGENNNHGPEFNFRMGFSFLQVREYQKAVNYLNQSLNNNLEQLAYYYLGVAYSFQKKYLDAAVAFQKASQLNTDTKIQETASFLELKLFYDAGNYETIIKNSDTFFSNFPNSKYKEELDHLYVSALENTGSHMVALSHITNMKVEELSPQLKNVYQSMAYQSAVGNYNDGNYDLAIALLKKSLRFDQEKPLTNQAHFWLGEIYQIQNSPDSAIYYYNKVDKRSRLYIDALYSLGYVYYNNRNSLNNINFKNAYFYFDKYVKYGDRKSDKYGDSHFLKGNCLLALGKYHDAVNSYDNALPYYSDRNLVLLQKANAYINNLEYQKAERSLSKLIYNNSANKSHRDFAYFELGLIYYKRNDYYEAKKWFDKLLKEYPSFQNSAEARHKLGFSKQQIAKNLMVGSKYQNGGRYPDEYYSAINDYKLLINNFIHTSYAKNAFKALTSIHNNEFKIQGYDKLKRLFQLNNPETAFWEDQDFAEAMLPFEKRNFSNAITSLLGFKEKYPNSNRLDQVHYNIGYCYQNIEVNDFNYSEAIKNFDLVGIGPYKIKAMRNAASLELTLGNFKETIIRYETFLNSITEDKHLLTAYLGLSEAFYKTHNYDDAIKYADKVIKSILNNSNDKLKAYFFKGKSFMKQEKYKEAITMLNNTLSITGKMAAEAQFIIGEIHFLQEEYEHSIDALLIVSNRYGDYREWQEKAYLLMGKNQIKLGHHDAASATLNAIIQNGTITEIKNQAIELLDSINLNENNIAE